MARPRRYASSRIVWHARWNGLDTKRSIWRYAYKANREGVAERLEEEAVQKTIEVDLALITYDDELLKDLELYSLKTAKQHDANTLYRLPTLPGIGKILSLVLLVKSMTSAVFPVCRTSPPMHA